MALKNILTVIFARRNAYKLREHRMRYAVGAQFTPSHLRNHALLRDDYDNRWGQVIIVRRSHCHYC